MRTENMMHVAARAALRTMAEDGRASTRWGWPRRRRIARRLARLRLLHGLDVTPSKRQAARLSLEGF